jgi:hypothetical protein
MRVMIRNTNKKLVMLLILILCLLGLSLIHQAQAECVSVTELIKNWSGNWLNSVSGVTITLSNGTVVWDDGTGPNNVIDIKGIWQGQTATIAWTDGKGTHSETVGPLYPVQGGAGIDSFDVKCPSPSGPVVVYNVINHPTVLTHSKGELY